MNIIIIDDEPVSLAVVKQLVSKLPNCEAHAFTNASSALIWCMNNTPHLAIVDYMMPTIDGIDFTRRLRALPTGRKVPVVMVSALIDRQVIKRALQSGVDDFLSKPFNFIELQTCVSEMLGLRAMQGQLANKELLVAAKALSAESPRGGVPQMVDPNVSRARLGGDERLLRDVARIFMHTVPGLMNLIRDAILDNDFEDALVHVVSLKGAVAALEAPGVSNLLQRLESHVRNQDPVATVAAFALVQALTERLLGELSRFVSASETAIDACHTRELDGRAPMAIGREQSLEDEACSPA